MIALYTELTLLRKGENETTTDYIIRAETAATALKTAEEIISDGLLIAMVLKGIIYYEIIKHFQPLLYKEQMTFSEFKTALRNYEENEKSCNPRDNQDNVMFSKQRFTGKCFKCDKQGHESSECRMKTEKWCVKCRSKTHNTKDCRANKKDTAKAVAEPEKDDTETHTFTFTLLETSENLKKTQETRRRHDEDPSLLVDTGATSHIIT